MINMEERHLAVLLPQDEEDLSTGRTEGGRLHSEYHPRCSDIGINPDRVAHLDDLAEEEPPADSGHLRGDSRGERPGWRTHVCISRYHNTRVPSWPGGWCCNPQADRGSCSWRAKMPPGTAKTIRQVTPRAREHHHCRAPTRTSWNI